MSAFKRIFLLVIFLCASSVASAQYAGNTARHIAYGATLPTVCNSATGDVFVQNNVNPTLGYLCTATNTWTLFGGSGGSCGTLGGNLSGTCAAASVKGVRTGLISGLPAACVVGEIYFATDAAAGANIYQCTATNTWSPPGGAASSSYSQTFTSQTSVTLTHNLGTLGVEVQCYDSASPPQRIETNTEKATTTNSYTVTFTSSQSGSCVVLSGSGAAGPTGPTGPPGGGPAGTQPNQPLTGLGIEYVSGLTFTVGAGTYQIGGTQYSSPLTSVTLAAADMSNPRIDVIYVDNTSAVNVLTGSPAATPSQPTVDYSTELPLNIVLVPTASSTPGGIATTLIYDENVEWTCTASAHFNCASTNNPYHGTKDIEATAAVLGNNVTLVKPAAGTVDLSTQNAAVCYIRSKAQWPTGNGSGANGLRTLSLFWLNGSTQVGLQVVIKDNAFGFLSNVTTTYQQITIPISLFGTGSNLVTTLKGQITGNGGSSSIGFYLDECSLQSGTGQLTLPITLMNFKGTWNSTANYNVNDTVISSGKGYVALAANTNVAVSTTATWAALNSGGTVTVCQGTIALGTSLIASGAKDSTKTLSCTGAITTDVARCSANADISGVTGYVPSGSGTLSIYPPWVTSNTINVVVGNNTATGITPSAVTLNCGVWR